MATDVREEELQAVGSAGDGTCLVALLGDCFLLLVTGIRLDDLDVVRLELALQQLGVLFTDVVLENECLELRGLELAAVLLGAFHERLHVLRFEELYELVLRQRLVSVLSFPVCMCDKLPESIAVFWRIPG